jgi:DNA-binding FadR family transcriptional regulator
MRRAKAPADFLALDTQFHLTLARASGNSVVPLILGAVRDAIARQMLAAFEALEAAGRWNAERAFLVKEHAQLVATIAAHDPEAAASAFSHHVHAFYTRVLSGSATTRPARRVASSRPAKKARPA